MRDPLAGSWIFFIFFDHFREEVQSSFKWGKRRSFRAVSDPQRYPVFGRYCPLQPSFVREALAESSDPFRSLVELLVFEEKNLISPQRTNKGESSLRLHELIIVSVDDTIML